jgi:hypothetical protein
MKLQHQKDLAIAIAAILAIAVILAIAAILAVSGHKEKPQLSCVTLLEEVVLNYIYSKLRTAAIHTYSRMPIAVNTACPCLSCMTMSCCMFVFCMSVSVLHVHVHDACPCPC